MIEPAAGSKDVVSFGPFTLDPRRRLLLKDGAPIAVGGRTLDTLMALVARPNEAISKRELMAVVWPDVTVEEGSLRVRIAALRKALGDGQGGARYITTLAGRGYCFVAPVSRLGGDKVGFAYANLPGRLTQIVGRDEDVNKLSKQLEACRLISIVGPGGIGKTTVAIA